MLHVPRFPGMLRCERDPDGTTVDAQLASRQAAKLTRAQEQDSLPDALIEVLTSASPAQLAAVAEICGTDLEDLIEEATEGLVFDDSDLKKCLLSVLKPRAEILCELLHEAFEGWGTNDDCVARILGTNDRKIVAAIAAQYEEKYGGPLADALVDELGGDFQGVVTAYLASAQSEEAAPSLELATVLAVDDVNTKCWQLSKLLEQAHRRLADIDAEQIRKASEGWGTDDDKLTAIMTTRTREQLALVDVLYREKYEQTLDEVIGSETSSDYGRFLKCLAAGTANANAVAIRRAIEGPSPPHVAPC